MARSNAPKFGNWDMEENISYTTYFENTRRVSSSEKVNPSSSPQNPVMMQGTLRQLEASRAKHERKVSQEDGELRRQVDSPSRPDGGRRASRESNQVQSVGVSSNTPKRAPRSNRGGFRSADHSPMHPQFQSKIAAKGMSSPSWEKRGSYEGGHSLAPSTPGRSRLKSVPRGNETPDRGTAVPKFGEWDESDPSSADGFSHIFSKVKEERHGSVGNAPGGGTQNQRSNGQKRHKSKDSKGCCCFPWGRN